MSDQTLAIVSTIRGVTRTYFTFLEHHLAVGFDRFYLFLDEPQREQWLVDEVAARPELAARVRFIPRDEALQRRIETFALYQEQREVYERSTVTRQRLHVSLGTERAAQEGVDWLMHIDEDELVVHLSGGSVREYLAAVPPSIEEVFVPNFEAIPEREEYTNPFREITRFKKNPYYLTKKQLDYLRYAHPRPQFYMGYASGKSVFRPTAMRRHEVPITVHHFTPDLMSEQLHIEDQGGPIVLHYPMAGFAGFMRRVSGFNANRLNEYEVLSENPDNLFALARRKLAARDFTGLRALYQEWVLFSNAQELARLRERGVLLEKRFLPESTTGEP